MDHSAQSASVIHEMQRRFQEEIADTITALQDATSNRKRKGWLSLLIGAACLLGLPILVLLNAAQDAPVLEYLLGITAGDPWDTPLGPLQPIAIAASIAFVIAMGLAALLALGHEAHPEPSKPRQNTPAAPAHEDAPMHTTHMDRRQMVRWIIAITVMLLLVAVIGYGSYLRGKLVVTEDNPLAAQNATVSCAFSVALALVEEIGVVGAMVGYLLPNWPVWATQRKLNRLRRGYKKIQDIAFIHEQLSEAEHGITQILVKCAPLQEKCDLHQKELVTVRDIPQAGAISDTDRIARAYQESKQILVTAKGAVDKLTQAMDPLLKEAECYRPRGRDNIKQMLEEHIAEEARFKQTLTDRKQKGQIDYQTHLNAARARTARWESAGLDKISEIGESLAGLRRQAEQLTHLRLTVLEGLHTGLNSPQFLEDYSSISQNKTLTRLGVLLIQLDGESSSRKEDTHAPVLERIKAALADIQQRTKSSLPANSVLGKLLSALDRCSQMRREAYERLDLTTHPDIVDRVHEVVVLKAEIADQLARLDARIQRVVLQLKDDTRRLTERLRQEEAEKHWFRRLLRKIFPGGGTGGGGTGDPLSMPMAEPTNGS